MYANYITAVFAVSLALSAGTAAASESLPRSASTSSQCSIESRDTFKPETDLRAIVERLGYRVTRVGIDDACYEVIAADRSGKIYEVRFTGADLRMISRHEVKGEHGSAAR